MVMTADMNLPRIYIFLSMMLFSSTEKVWNIPHMPPKDINGRNVR